MNCGLGMAKLAYMGSFWLTTVNRLPSCDPAVMRLPTVRYSRLANPETGEVT